MRGTKLWQAAGSPLIEGRSRLERPFAQDFLAAFATTIVVGICSDTAIPWPANPAAALLESVSRSGLGVVVAAVLACTPAIALSRAARLGRPWLVGALAGCAFAAGAVWMSGGFA